MRKKIVIHSHFYQPPRENPDTLVIEDESSAFPFHNWNERITYECYRANAYSRYLDKDGKVKKIFNNYKSMSYNFGPTLLSYLKEFYPNIVESIKEADKESVALWGEGNAIAQGYNHTILPLDDEDFARVQIRWALDFFKSFYKREAKGFWCPECAISPFVIDLLYEEGVQFTILSPLQVKHLVIDKKVVEPVLPTHLNKPYWIKGNKHKIAAFFYNAELSTDISFNHLLRDADKMYEKLLDMETEDLILAATDGEIYGHHEPYGDMAFAALSEKIRERDDFELTNLAAYLKANPPKHEAVLHSGEENMGSSWSCMHGVSRWYKDCGCQTGAAGEWNQKWRTPLRNSMREAYKEVKKAVYSILEKEGLDPYKTILGYAKALHEGDKSYFKNDKVNLALEAYKWAAYAFTSCGWFFADISGIEPRHNISYMIKALNLLSADKVKEKFINSLKDAKSNIDPTLDGINIARSISESYTAPKLREVLALIYKNGLTSENIGLLKSSLYVTQKDVTSKTFFEAQNLICMELTKTKPKHSTDIEYIVKYLDLSPEILSK